MGEMQGSADHDDAPCRCVCGEDDDGETDDEDHARKEAEDILG